MLSMQDICFFVHLKAIFYVFGNFNFFDFSEKKGLIRPFFSDKSRDFSEKKGQIRIGVQNFEISKK